MAVDDQYTKSLLHFDSDLTDESGKIWTPMGSATLSTAQSRYGNGSLYLNGTSQYLTTPNSTDFDFGNGDFTIDFWVNFTNASKTSSLLDKRSGPAFTNWSIFQSSSNLTFNATSAGSSWDISPSKIIISTITANQWYHAAVVRSGSNFYLFSNGAITTQFTSSGTITNISSLLYLGVNNSNYFNGYIDELRISKGTARWTAPFTPPYSSYSPYRLKQSNIYLPTHTFPQSLEINYPQG